MEPETLETLEHLRITDTTPIPEPEPFLIINDEVIAVADEFFTISGASKSGKSAFTSMLIASSISIDGKILDGLEGVEVLRNDQQRAVIHIDTEQARHKHQRNLKSILKRAKLPNCPEHFRSYNIRELEINEYQTITDEICNTAVDLCGGIHSIWIDGGADYVKDVNDPDTSGTIVKYFGDLSSRYHTPVFIIVHTNPGNDKERGHFGSQCQRKSGGIISIKTEGDYSYIEGKYLRYAGKGDIPKLMFKYDKEKGYHTGAGVLSEEVDQEAKARNKIIKTFEICQRVFSGQRAYKYKDAIDQIIVEIGKSTAPAKNLFTVMKAKGMIIQGKDEFWRINNSYVV